MALSTTRSPSLTAASTILRNILKYIETLLCALCRIVPSTFFFVVTSTSGLASQTSVCRSQLRYLRSTDGSNQADELSHKTEPAKSSPYSCVWHCPPAIPTISEPMRDEADCIHTFSFQRKFAAPTYNRSNAQTFAPAPRIGLLTILAQLHPPYIQRWSSTTALRSIADLISDRCTSLCLRIFEIRYVTIYWTSPDFS